VPPDDVTLQPGHRVAISVPGIGTLTNDVARSAEIVITQV
jgi:fumarylacetoacetate (FAA) hydrolase family protein